MFTKHSAGKHRLFALLATILIMAMLSSGVLAAPAAQSGPLQRLEQQSNGAVRVFTYQPTGVANWIDAEYGVLTTEFADKAANQESAARAFLASYGSLLGISNPAAQLELENIKTDTLGMHHVRFDQRQNGVPVFAADVVVHFNARGGVVSVNGYIVPDAPLLNTAPKLSEKQAGELAIKYAGLPDGYLTESSLTVLNPGLITERTSQTYLTYRVHVDSLAQSERAQWVFVDAHSGDLRFAYASHPESRNRNTYNMKHGTSYTSATLARNESAGPVTSATSCTVADINNAHDYAGNTYDFYYSRYGRDSYNNAGGALNSYVCYSSNYQNAFWDGSKMTYGDGFAAADDVVAHELSHGVTEYASGLVYSYQSGALNESYSDIFGEAVDLTNGGGTDTSTVRWDMGEDIPGIGAIRDMMDPTRFGDPDKTSSANMVCSSSDNGGVHTNSGVPNKAYALMVDGGTFNGYTVTAIGIDAASAVQYRTNEYKLTSSSNFYNNYLALLQSCAELYGAGSATCGSVKNAAEAVEMHKAVCGSGGGPTATPAGTTTPPPATNTPTNTPIPATPTATPLPGACSTFTSSDVPKAITDLTSALSTVTVSAGGTVSDVNVTIGSLTHTYDGDLDIYLRHPDGTEINLSDDNGGSSDNYTNTVFDDEATTAITAGAAPFTGSFKPEAMLSGLDSKTAAGTWTLRVYDDASTDTGQLSAWSVTICTSGGATATPVPATATPTRTPTSVPATATPTRTPTSVPATATPVPTTPPASALVNPGFELGRNVGWAESSAKGYALVSSGTARTGSWRAWLGGGNSETAEISQNYTVPTSGATLTYWYKITSTDSCGYDYGYVRVNTTTVKTYNLCSTSATSSYVQGSVSLAAYAGQTVSLRFRATTDSSYSSSFYIDDVAVVVALQIIPDDGGMEGEQRTQPQPKPLGVETEEITR
ncbi:MAG: M4 family metallopeptidase [Caldilineales bacterium]